MKGAKELADEIRDTIATATHECSLIGALKDARAFLAAIDSAVPGEVKRIQRRFDLYGMCDADAKALLAIVQRQEGEIAALKQEHFAATLAIEQTLHEMEQRSDAARAEVERLQALVDEFKAASMLDVNGDPDGVTPRLLEGHVTALQTEVDRLKTERTTLAQENARLINEVGVLDATAREQRQRAEVLARGIAAYRVGGFTAGQVWENGEGKAVQ